MYFYMHVHVYVCVRARKEDMYMMLVHENCTREAHVTCVMPVGIHVGQHNTGMCVLALALMLYPCMSMAYIIS